MQDDPKTLVSTDWLASRLHDPEIRILDASFYLPDAGRDARAEYDAGHIPGAQFCDIEDISDPDADLPHMAPSAEIFISCVQRMGIGDGHQVVVYDGAGLFSAARIWWLFRLMGKTDVAVLDGGLPKWIAEGRALDTSSSEVGSAHVIARHQPHLIKNATEVMAASQARDHEIVDARSPGRFRGEDPEPRAGMRGGHIPGSKNIHYAKVLNGDQTLKSPQETRAVFEAAGVDLTKPVITTCGSGVTAAILSLAMARMGKDDHALYDGSWSEWGLSTLLPVATGDD